MKPGAKHRNHTRTAYIFLNTRKCQACWKCMEVCSNHVIGRINFPFHKHARIVNENDCTGCLKCVKVCESEALTKITNNI